MFGKKRLILCLNEIILQAEGIGLPQPDLNIAKEYIEYNEFGAALEHIIDQLFEFDIQINKTIYDLIILAGSTMEMDEAKLYPLKNLPFIKN